MNTSAGLKDGRIRQPKQYFGVGFGWMHESEFIAAVKKGVEAYAKAQPLKARLAGLSEARANHFRFRFPYKKEELPS
jgi:hypothetical protein